MTAVPQYGLERMAVFEEAVYMYAKVKAQAEAVDQVQTLPTRPRICIPSILLHMYAETKVMRLL